MNHPDLSVFDATEAEAIRKGMADITAGRIVSHTEVVRWLKSWGTTEELPPPSTRAQFWPERP